MKKYNIFIYIAISSTVLFSGCKKFLEHQPDDRTELNSPVKVAELLANAYPHGNYIAFAEAMSDNAGDKGGTSRQLPNSSPWNYVDQIDATVEDTPPFYWNACYKAIAAANYALEAIDKAGNTSQYSASRGEALVARAYAHFMLVTFFAKAYDPATAATDPGIPYVTEPQKVVEGNYTRGTVASVYDNIEKDLLAGIPLINDSYRVPKYHFTKVAANAFATRFYLFKRQYQKVIDYANAAFPASTIGDNLRQWNTTYNILGYYELQALYTNSTEPSNLLLQEANSYWGDNYAGYNYGLSSAVRAVVFNAGNNPTGKALAMTTKIFGGNETVYNIPKFRLHFVKQTISANFGDGYNMVPLFTAEEVLFNRAEANAMLGTAAGNAAAIVDIDVYLSKRIVGYSATADKFTEAKATNFYKAPFTVQEALVNTILNFKRQEYMHEGLRWLDLLRLKIPVVHLNSGGQVANTLGANDPKRLIQIPQEAIAAGLAPNPR